MNMLDYFNTSSLIGQFWRVRRGMVLCPPFLYEPKTEPCIQMCKNDPVI